VGIYKPLSLFNLAVDAETALSKRKARRYRRPGAALAPRQPSRFSADRPLARRRRMATYPMCGACRQRGTVMLILNVMLLMAFLIMVAISLVEVLGSHHARE
jgi:hypothetical protein